jgi:hypothetical protein
MGSLRLSLLLLLLSSLGFSQPTVGFSQPVPSSQPKTYTVAGQVINQLTGAPIPRALVQISGKAQLTGGQGEFSFAAVTEGRTQITLTKPGYFSTGARNRYSPPVPLTVSSDSDKLVLKMVPESVIVGQVTGNDREPLEGAQLVLLQYSSGVGPSRLVPAPMGMNARTDEDGNFRIAGLSSGRYYLAVKAGNVTRSILGAQSLKKNATYQGVVYYPGTADFAAALPIVLAPGQKLDANFELTLVPAYNVSGTLVSTAGLKQLFPPGIIDATGQTLFPVSSFDEQSGRFEFKSLPVRGGADIPVIIRTEFSKPQTPSSCTSHQAGGTIVQSDCSDFPRAHVELLSPESIQSSYTTDYGPQKDPGGLAIRNVPAGKYVVRARATFGGYVQSIRSGQLDLLREELIIPEDGQVSPIEVTVRDDGGTVQVRLRSDNANQTATVVLLPLFGVLPEPQAIGVTTSSGQIQTPWLAPGNYKLFAFDAGTGISYGNYEGLDKYAAQATTVTVSANSNSNVLLDVIKGETQ